ncbi:CLUMA_CG013907, isoform A [Clunio marinus]|uniref:CLUMA_CG013907, isoform A n=1 Tax=Clunio marinus TaxID=568069 RepID=A0A1J1IK82_9DIPT|nr:CLUMA_CG013907, isoform A [Clunio marinus]
MLLSCLKVISDPRYKASRENKAFWHANETQLFLISFLSVGKQHILQSIYTFVDRSLNKSMFEIENEVEENLVKNLSSTFAVIKVRIVHIGRNDYFLSITNRVTETGKHNH